MVVNDSPTMPHGVPKSDSRHSSLQSLQALCSEYGPPLQPDQHMCWSAQSFLGRPSWLRKDWGHEPWRPWPYGFSPC